eukprot:gene61835-84570_t
MRTEYRIDDFQQNYFVIPSFDELLRVTVETDFAPLYDEISALPDIAIAAFEPDDVVISRGTQDYAKSRRAAILGLSCVACRRWQYWDEDRGGTMAKIMFTRHAEKPFGTTQGVGPDGTANPEDLIVRGWQRAGALVRFFAPRDPADLAPGIATPTAIFASDAASAGASLRP